MLKLSKPLRQGYGAALSESPRVVRAFCSFWLRLPATRGCTGSAAPASASEAALASAENLCERLALPVEALSLPEVRASIAAFLGRGEQQSDAAPSVPASEGGLDGGLYGAGNSEDTGDAAGNRFGDLEDLGHSFDRASLVVSGPDGLGDGDGRGSMDGQVGASEMAAWFVTELRRSLLEEDGSTLRLRVATLGGRELQVNLAPNAPVAELKESVCRQLMDLPSRCVQLLHSTVELGPEDCPLSDLGVRHDSRLTAVAIPFKVKRHVLCSSEVWDEAIQFLPADWVALKPDEHMIDLLMDMCAGLEAKCQGRLMTFSLVRGSAIRTHRYGSGLEYMPLDGRKTALSTFEDEDMELAVFADREPTSPSSSGMSFFMGKSMAADDATQE
eukprot:TRINITY_DN461_c0_g3_i1.p1 TRINITY_DN461_c0_g3~~TRINITY_DN461_c0_g3_i1.p1  ORF type:complete len:387 (-),score=72.88 TRINITY_DN461_c0_g3_i1:55-1215(-)